MAIIDLTINAQGHLQTLPADWPGGFWWHWAVFSIIIIMFVLPMVMGFVWIERRGMARMLARLLPPADSGVCHQAIAQGRDGAS